MPLWKTSVITILLLLCSVLPSAAMGQDIGVRGGSEPAEPKRPAATRRATPRQPPRTSAPAPTKPKRRATLTIVTDPSECEVYLNDSYRGTTAMSNGKLVIPDLDTAAKYTLRVYKRDTGEEIQTFALEEDHEMNISLKKQETATNRQPEKEPEKLPEK